MDRGLLLLFALTFIIHLIGTLAYSVRISGTRTRRIAISLSLFNILILISRTSNSFQALSIAKTPSAFSFNNLGKLNITSAILNTRIIQFANDKEKPYVGIRLPWN